MKVDRVIIVDDIFYRDMRSCLAYILPDFLPAIFLLMTVGITPVAKDLFPESADLCSIVVLRAVFTPSIECPLSRSTWPSLVIASRLVDCGSLVIASRLVDCGSLVIASRLVDCGSLVIASRLVDCDSLVIASRLVDCGSFESRSKAAFHLCIGGVLVLNCYTACAWLLLLQLGCCCYCCCCYCCARLFTIRIPFTNERSTPF